MSPSSSLRLTNCPRTLSYLQRPGSKNEKIHQFPAGLKMLAGNPFRCVRRRLPPSAPHASSLTSSLALQEDVQRIELRRTGNLVCLSRVSALCNLPSPSAWNLTTQPLFYVLAVTTYVSTSTTAVSPIEEIFSDYLLILRLAFAHRRRRVGSAFGRLVLAQLPRRHAHSGTLDRTICP